MKRIIVHCEQEITQMALMEHGQLVEFTIENSQGRQLVGNLYKGRVVNVLPGMQAAFVDIGLKKNAFLYIDDVLHPHLEKQPKVKPSISQLLQAGQEIVVQVMKEPLGGKGARVTTHYSLPGRWLVYMPHADYIGVSKKIELDAERNRLKQIGDHVRLSGEGLILRTVAEGESKEAIESDIQLLRALWIQIEERAAAVSAPAQLHQDLSIIERLVRDMFTPQTERVIIDDLVQKEEIASFLSRVLPDWANRVEVYKGSEPILTHYGVKEQLDRAFEHKVWLRNGGYLVVDYTEALTVIDVNTGKFIGSNTLEDTVYETNMQAAEEIARLLRLRDIGGIILIDFIDMDMERHRQDIWDKLELLMRSDRTKHLILGWTKLGLLEMTRKKVRDHALNPFTEPCSVCKGTGRINSTL